MIYSMFKRIFDIVFSFILFFLLFPFLLLIGVLIKLTSSGPAVYKHTRIGKDGRLFLIFKFRTMVVDARNMQEKGVSSEKLVTPVGRFLRRTFLDETLQLFNIIMGDMSFIGPRPMDKEYFDNLVLHDKRWLEILKVKPGLSSLESVADYLPLNMRRKFEEHFDGLLRLDKDSQFYKHRYVLDKYYIDKRSLFLDLRIGLYSFLLMIEKLIGKV